MRRDHAPAFRHTHPTLHLPPDLAGAGLAPEQGGAGGVIPAKGGDHRAFECPGEAVRRPSGPEGLDGLVAIKVFAATVADGARVAPEKSIECRHIVADEGGLILC